MKNDQTEAAWIKFEKTGKIADYLAYREKQRTCPQNHSTES